MVVKVDRSKSDEARSYWFIESTSTNSIPVKVSHEFSSCHPVVTIFRRINRIVLNPVVTITPALSRNSSHEIRHRQVHGNRIFPPLSSAPSIQHSCQDMERAILPGNLDLPQSNLWTTLQ